MAIIAWPDDVAATPTVRCIICQTTKPAENVTAVVRDVDRTQKFACNGHFRDGGTFILGLADFAATQRQEALKKLGSKGWYEWSLY